MNGNRSTNNSRWGIIADDLTGACDTGAIFAQKGLATVVILDRKLAPPPNTEIIVLTTSSRNEPAREAVRKVEAACRYLAARRIRVLYKKIDSTLKGNIAIETASVAKTCGFSRAIICPAYPAQGRAVRRGTLIVRGKPAAEVSSVFSDARPCDTRVASCSPSSPREERVGRGTRRGETDGNAPPLPNPLLHPMEEKETPRSLMQPYCNTVAVHLPLTASKLIAAISAKSQFVLPDAATNSDLDLLVQAARESKKRVLLAGSGGLTTALAGALIHHTGSAPPTKIRRSKAPIAFARPLLVFSGSNNPATGCQIDTLIRSRHVRIHPLHRTAITEVRASLHKHQLAVVRVPVHLLPDTAILQTLSEFDFLFRGSGLGSLVVIGGDTAALILRWLGTRAIGLGGEIAPGIPWGRIIGGKADGLALCTKAGGFGKRNSLLQIINFLARRRPSNGGSSSSC